MKRRRCDDAGASLLLALVFLSGFGLFISSTLYFVEASVVSSRQASETARALYVADGGIESAIQYLRDKPSLGRDGGPCVSVTLEGTAVTCTPEPLSGADIGLRQSAITAYGQHPSEGIRVSGNRDFAVGGDVVSNSKIALDDPIRLKAYGEVSAIGCEPSSASVVSMRGGSPDCAATLTAEPTTQPKLITSPLPEPGSPGLPVQQPDAALLCGAGARTIQLSPGYYDDVTRLNALTGVGPCRAADKVIQFLPGLYYFDFASCSQQTTPCEWSIDLPNGAVVGGKAVVNGSEVGGPDPFGANLSPLPPRGNCLTRGKPGDGVQFVFGGDSRLSVQDGTVELCGETTPDGSRAVIYGLPTRPLREHIASPPENTRPIGPNQAEFSQADQAQKIDTSLTEATLDGPYNTASIDFDFPLLVPEIPPAASIDAVALRVRHKEVGGRSELTAMVSSPTDAFAAFPVTVVPSSVLTEQEIHLPGLRNRDALNNGIKIAFVATRSSSESVSVLLDGIELAIAAETPSTPQPLVVKATSTASVPANSFLPDDTVASRIIDGTTAQATLNPANPTASVDVTLPALASASGIPTGVAIEAAVLRVAHRDPVSPTALGLTVEVTPTIGSPGQQSIPADNPELGTDDVDLMALGLDTPQELNGGIVARFTAQWLEGETVTEALDGIELIVSYNFLADDVTSPSGTFTNPGFAKTIDGSDVATAIFDTVPATASLEFLFPALSAPSTIPPGSMIDSAVLRLAHVESEFLELSITVTPAATTGKSPRSTSLVSGQNTVDLRDLFGPDTAAMLNASKKVLFTVTSSGSPGTASVDGIELAVTYTPAPAFRPPTPGSCLLIAPYTRASSATCPLLEVAGAARLAVHGSIHGPRNPVDLTIEDDAVLIERGIASRTSWFQAVSTRNVTAPGVLPTLSTDVPSTGFVDPGHATVIDVNNVAVATLDAASTTASLGLSFPSNPDRVPMGATIERAFLRVAHAELGDPATSLSLEVVVAPGSRPALPGVTLPADNATLAVDAVDLRALGLDTPAELNESMAVKFTAIRTAGGAVTESLDGIELVVDYSPGSINPLATAASDPPTGFADPDSAVMIGGGSAVATLDATAGPATASIDFTFPSLIAAGGIPAGSTIERAIVEVAHAEDIASSLELAVQLTPATGLPPAAQPLDADNLTTPDVDEIDLRALGLDTVEELSGLLVRFSATLAKGGPVTESLDGIELVISYTPPVTCSVRSRPPTRSRTVTLSTTDPVGMQATVEFDDEAAASRCEQTTVKVLDWAVRRPESTT